MVFAKKIDPVTLTELIAAGRSTAEIAAHFGVQSPAVCRACHAHGLPLPLGRVGQSRGHRQPTRADDLRDLAFLKDVASGLGYVGTARRHGVSPMTVQNVVKAVEAADLAESGEPVAQVAKAYPRQKIGGRR
jgi:hypothetical protein